MPQAAHSMNRQNDRVFYVAMSVAVLVTVLVGFAPTYYLRDHFYAGSLPLFLHVHGLVFSSWIVVFVAQTTLVAAGHIALHRRLGIAGAVLAGVLVVVGLNTAIVSGQRNAAAGNAAGAIAFLATPFADMFVFAVLASAAISYRHRADIHKRLMLLATISILSAPIARWPLAIMAIGPWAVFGFTDVFLAAAVLYDLATRRRVHAAYLWGGLLLVASQPLRLAMADTSLWRAFAGALVK
jgi:uncharacterized membrane protein YozB (DUF420 family)